MDIEYITHASLLLKSKNCSILLDPFYIIDPEYAGIICHFPPREISSETFGTLNYVFSSHIHPDHSHPETLKLLKDKTQTVLLPAERPDLETRYRNLGFDDIILLENRQPLTLQEGVEVVCYWDDPIDSVLLVKMDNKIVFHQNDCHLQVDTLKEIAAKYLIDYAFLLYTESQDLYPLLLPKSKSELKQLVAVREQQFLEVQLQCLDILKPQTVIPYSFTVTYFQPDQIHLNGYSRFTPGIFCQLLAERQPQIQYLVIQPGDIVNCESRSILHYRDTNLWGTTITEFIHNIVRYRETNSEKLPRFNDGDPNELDSKLKSYLQERLLSPFLKIFERRTFGLHISGADRIFSYLIDLKNKRITSWNNTELEPSTIGDITISMPASILEQLLNKKYDPLSIIYTYKIKFKPNIKLKMSPKAEVMLYVFTIISIFNYELIESGEYQTRYSILGQWN